MAVKACPDCGAEMRDSNIPRHIRNVHGYTPGDKRRKDSVGTEREVDAEPRESESPFGGEVLPEVPDKGPGAGGFFGRFRKPKGDAPPRPPKREARPRRIGKRKDASTLLGAPFDIASEVTAQMLPATSRMLAAEAPWAGYVLDEAIAGTLIDRIAVQPMAKVQDRVGMIGSVVGPPAMVFQMETHPERIPVMLPMLARSLRMAAPYIARGLKKKRAADAAAAEAMAELYPDAPEGADIGQYMISEIFGASYEDLMNHGRGVAQQRAAAAHEPQPESENDDVHAA